MPNARDDYKQHNKTQTLNEGKCHIPGRPQGAVLNRGTPFTKYLKFSWAVLCGVTAWQEPALLSDSTLATGVQRSGGAIERSGGANEVGYCWNPPRLLLGQALRWPLREFV